MRAQLRQAGNRCACIVFAASLSAIPRVLKQRLPRRTIAQRLQRWLLRRVLQRKHPTFRLAILRSLRRRPQLRIAQPRKRRLICRSKCCLFGSGQQLRRKCVGEIRNLFIHLFQRSLVSLGEPSPGAHKSLIVFLHKPQRFRIKMQRIPLFVNLGNPLEQLVVQVDRVGHRGTFRRHFAPHILQHRVRICACYSTESRHHAAVQLPSLFHRDNGVFKRRLRGIVGDRTRLLQLMFNAGLNRRQIVGILDLVEWRRVKRQCTRRIKRVVWPERRGNTLGGQGARGQRNRAGSHQRGNLRHRNPHSAHFAHVHGFIQSIRAPIQEEPAASE